MHILLIPVLAFALAVPAQAMKAPREESPTPRDLVELLGSGNSDEELARAIAAADAYPLGTLENPIRVEGPEGAQAYLARLRCADGSTPTIGSKQSGAVGTYGSVVDQFSVSCGTAGPGQVTLAMDIYHAENVETRAPSGFSLAPR